MSDMLQLVVESHKHSTLQEWDNIGWRSKEGGKADQAFNPAKRQHARPRFF